MSWILPCFRTESEQWCRDIGALADFVKIADKYQIDRSRIEFEITEAVLLDASQIKNVREGLQMIHQYGFKSSIDDFGTGYSSLSLLQEFDIDTLKLDRSFFQDINNAKARDVVACIVDIAKKLDIRTVVEGIETLQQVEYLKKMECNTIQGFFFSRPLPIPEFEQWLYRFQILDYMKIEKEV
nr:EAL domain-containing protein [uncultured Blautia sp.]